MKMFEKMPKEIFLNLEEREVAGIVRKLNRPLSVVLVPDNTRRTGIIYNHLDAKSKNFEKDLFDALSPKFISLIKTIFNHGVRILFIPSLTHGNLNRSKKYVNSHFKYATRYILQENNWLNLYEEKEIKVRIYGDRNYISALGFDHFNDWAEKVEKLTAPHEKHLLFWGYACSSSIENMRILNLCIDFFNEYGRKPTLQEARRLYYYEDVYDIDIFIRPGEIRDSDCQPPLLGGRAEMYFPVCPLTELELGFFKEILYDFLFNRVSSKGNKQYNQTLGYSDLKKIQNYHNQNKAVIFGLGERVGELWIPSNKSLTNFRKEEAKRK